MHQTASGGGRFALTRTSSASPPLGSALHGPHNAAWLVSPLPSKSLNGNHIVLSQISNLVSQITKRNYRQTSHELSLVCLALSICPSFEYCGGVERIFLGLEGSCAMQSGLFRLPVLEMPQRLLEADCPLFSVVSLCCFRCGICSCLRIMAIWRLWRCSRTC